jgi:hypothetical protein
MNNIGRAFSFPFEDRNWFAKFLLGSIFLLLCLFGLGIFVIAGYLVQLTQRVMKNEPFPMPEWSDIGVKFVVGFKFCVVYFLYMIPVLVLLVPAFLFAMIGEIAELPDAASFVLAVYLFGLFLVIIPYSIGFTLLLPIITYRFAEREKITDGLDLAAVLREFKANWQTTTVAALLTLGVQLLASFGFVLFIIGVIFTIFYACVVSAYLAGALYQSRKSAS